MWIQYLWSAWTTYHRCRKVDILISIYHYLANTIILDDPRLPSLRDPPVRLASHPFIVEKDGEMPQGSTPRTSQPVSRHQTPVPFESRTSSPLPTSSFPPYITADDLHSSTPEPIKVIRSKK